MIARLAAEVSTASLVGVVSVWAILAARPAECPAPPLHRADVACVCLLTVEPPSWECWAVEP